MITMTELTIEPLKQRMTLFPPWEPLLPRLERAERQEP